MAVSELFMALLKKKKKKKKDLQLVKRTARCGADTVQTNEIQNSLYCKRRNARTVHIFT